MRIVSGQLARRPLRTVPGHSTRPTTDRARAGLFDWLGGSFEELRVLDLFAGTGALGIEALSRGATQAVFVERSRRALDVLRRNLRELEVTESARVLGVGVGRALTALVAEGAQFELILADPPYESDEIARLLCDARLVELLAPGGAIVAERSARRDPASVDASGIPRETCRRTIPRLTWVGTKVYGETAFDWYATTAEAGG